MARDRSTRPIQVLAMYRDKEVSNTGFDASALSVSELP